MFRAGEEGMRGNTWVAWGEGERRGGGGGGEGRGGGGGREGLSQHTNM